MGELSKSRKNENNADISLYQIYLWKSIEILDLLKENATDFE